MALIGKNPLTSVTSLKNLEMSQCSSDVPMLVNFSICLTSLTCAKCGVRSTLCWKIPNISGSIELFAL